MEMFLCNSKEGEESEKDKTEAVSRCTLSNNYLLPVAAHSRLPDGGNQLAACQLEQMLHVITHIFLLFDRD